MKQPRSKPFLALQSLTQIALAVYNPDYLDRIIPDDVKNDVIAFGDAAIALRDFLALSTNIRHRCQIDTPLLQAADETDGSI